MSKDQHSGGDPGLPMSAEDEAFLRLVEDSYEAAGQPKDQIGAERVWGKLEARLASHADPSPVGPQKRGQVRWLYATGFLGAAAALLLFLNVKKPASENPQDMTVRGTASGFTASIIVYDDSPKAAPPGSRHQIKVNVTADADGYVALFRQEGQADPVFVSNLEYKKDQGDMHMLQENAGGGTRYCIVGARDMEGLKHLVEIIGQMWAYLPQTACYLVP